MRHELEPRRSGGDVARPQVLERAEERGVLALTLGSGRARGGVEGRGGFGMSSGRFGPLPRGEPNGERRRPSTTRDEER